MKAIRIPIPDSGDIFAAVADCLGGYCGPQEGIGLKEGKQIPVRRVSFRLPFDGGVGWGVAHCQEPPHNFTEEPDGTLTITASILCEQPNQSGKTWHGYLTKGEWITA